MSVSVWDPSGVGFPDKLEKVPNVAADLQQETTSMKLELWHLKWESLKTRRRAVDSYYHTNVWKVKPASIQCTNRWHFSLPLVRRCRTLLILIHVFISVVFSPRPLGVEIHFQTFLSPLLKAPSKELLSSLLWWELGTNLPGPGEWLLFWRVTSKQFWFWFWFEFLSQ